MYQLAESWANIKFKDGYNPDVQCMRVTMDPVLSYHRPLTYYAVTSGILKVYAYFYFTKYGFLMHLSGSLRYWYKPPPAGASAEPPLVFCHGLGIGNVPYLTWISILSQLPRGIFVLELPHISMNITEDCPSNYQLSACLKGMLHSWDYKTAHFCGHSFGSVVLAWLCRAEPTIASHFTFIDPVCFLLSKPDVTFNIVYRNPETPGRMIMQYLISRELYTSNALTRHFDWKETILWPEDLKVPTLIVLCGKDEILPAVSVERYMSAVAPKRKPKEKIDVLMFENLRHGDIMWADTNNITTVISRMIALEK